MKHTATHVTRIVVLCGSVCWSGGYPVQNWLKWSRCSLGTDLSGAQEPDTLSDGSRSPHKKGHIWRRHGWQDGDAVFCQINLDTRFSTSNLLSRPNKMGLKSPSVHVSVHTSVHLSTNSFFDFSESWHVIWGRWVMHFMMVCSVTWPDPRSRSRSWAVESWISFHF